MCLAVPGKIQAIRKEGNLLMGDVNFSGVVKSICLSFTPEAKEGDYVIVHVGFSISILDEKEAQKTLKLTEVEFEVP